MTYAGYMHARLEKLLVERFDVDTIVLLLTWCFHLEALLSERSDRTKWVLSCIGGTCLRRREVIGRDWVKVIMYLSVGIGGLPRDE
jgi:hypothetical protein